MITAQARAILIRTAAARRELDAGIAGKPVSAPREKKTRAPSLVTTAAATTPCARPSTAHITSTWPTLEQVIADHIRRTLERSRGNISVDARELGIYRSSLQRQLRRIQLR